MSDWNFWLYITGYTGATVARLVIQAINAARKDRLGTKVFAGILAGVAVAGVAINFAIIFLMMEFLPTVLQHAGFHVFTSIFLELVLSFLGVKLGLALAPGKDVDTRATSYTCDDGHVVRSRGEALIDNWFNKTMIAHDYEKTITLGGNPVKYDWYLLDFNIFVEYWGFHGKKYQERRKQKEILYEKHGKQLLSIEDKDLEDVNVSLRNKLSRVVDASLFSKPARCFNCGVVLDERYA